MVGTLYTESRVTDILDKKSGALIILDCTSLSLPPSLINLIAPHSPTCSWDKDRAWRGGGHQPVHCLHHWSRRLWREETILGPQSKQNDFFFLYLSLYCCTIIYPYIYIANHEASQPLSRCFTPNADPPIPGCPLPTQWRLQSFAHWCRLCQTRR